MAAQRLSLRRSTIASRLAILVALPLVGVLALGSVIATDAWSDSVAAQELRRDAQVVDLLSEIAVTVEAEADGYNAMLSAEAMGVPILGDAGSVLIGSVDWEGSLLDDLIAELRLSNPAAFADPEGIARLTGDLDDLMTTMDGGDPVAGARFTELRDRIGRDVDQALAAQTERLDVRFAEVEPPAELRAVHAAIGPVQELRAAARDERIAIGLHLLPIADEEGGSESDRYLDVVSANALYRQRLASVSATIPPEYRDLLRTATEGEELARYRRLVDDAVAGDAAPVAGEDELMSLLPIGLVIFVDGLDAITELSDLTAQLTTDFADGAAQVEAEANARLIRVTLAVTLLAVLMISISFLTIRSITSPMQRLLDRARRITDGQLGSVVGSSVAGPTDIALVHNALDEMTTNLTTLSDQAEALSAGRLDDAVLSRQVVGRLGESLHGSVARLRSMTARLEHEATHDALTGLPNRAAVMAFLDLLLTGSEANRKPLAAVMLDLDGFKQANDNMGHSVGDEVLCLVANRLRLRGHGHFVARLGGDEFMLVITAESGDDPVELAQGAIHAICEPMRLSCGTMMVSGSAGLVRTDGDNWLSPSEILRRVDLALYEAKADSPGTVVEFDQRLHDSLLASTQLSGELRQALSRDEFFLVAQPIVDMDGGGLKGFEALLRWRSPLRGLVPPDVFIGVAEQSELIAYIDTWVIRQTSAMLAEWQRTPGLEHLTLSINISARNLSRIELPVEIKEAIGRHQIRPESYLVEMTESRLIPNLARAEDNLRRLKDLGVRIAIDDFGTGYASVAHLRSVDFDRLKIDRSFLTHLDDETDRSLANLLVSLGRDLKLDVVAEGIETEEQLLWAQGAGCTHGQGYLFGRPQPVETITPATVAELDRSVRRLRMPQLHR